MRGDRVCPARDPDGKRTRLKRTSPAGQRSATASARRRWRASSRAANATGKTGEVRDARAAGAASTHLPAAIRRRETREPEEDQDQDDLQRLGEDRGAEVLDVDVRREEPGGERGHTHVAAHAERQIVDQPVPDPGDEHHLQDDGDVQVRIDADEGRRGRRRRSGRADIPGMRSRRGPHDSRTVAAPLPPGGSLPNRASRSIRWRARRSASRPRPGRWTSTPGMSAQAPATPRVPGRGASSGSYRHFSTSGSTESARRGKRRRSAACRRAALTGHATIG